MLYATTIHEVVTAAAATFAIDPAQLYQGWMRRRRGRSQRVYRARQVAIYLALDKVDTSLSALGRHFHLHHTSILYHERLVKAALRAGDEDLREAVEDTREILQVMRLRRIDALVRQTITTDQMRA